MIRSILVALDGSERGSDVLAAAADLSVRFGARLFPFRAVTVPPEFPPAAHITETDTLPAYLDHAARNELHALLSRFELDYEPPIISLGQPWREILREADLRDVDLIVIGSHGYCALDRVLGTTAAKVVNLAERNVLVVHTRKTPKM